jgi:hypothetical protein
MLALVLGLRIEPLTCKCSDGLFAFGLLVHSA